MKNVLLKCFLLGSLLLVGLVATASESKSEEDLLLFTEQMQDSIIRLKEDYGVTSRVIGNEFWKGLVIGNKANPETHGEGDRYPDQKPQSGFHHLEMLGFPGVNLGREGIWKGNVLNFEHMSDGSQVNAPFSFFSPRVDPAYVFSFKPHQATLFWPSWSSSWDAHSIMAYTMRDEGYIDIDFTFIPTKDRYPLGYVTMFWASYMDTALTRRIFMPSARRYVTEYGNDQWSHEYGWQHGWHSFGEDMKEPNEDWQNPRGFYSELYDIYTEMGVIGSLQELLGATMGDVLPHEPGPMQAGHIHGAHPCNYLGYWEPVYYALIDADGDMGTTDDTYAWIMMFDNFDIRLSMYNWGLHTHRPALDWGWLVRNPEVGETYSYKARLAVVPYEGLQSVIDEYRKWLHHIKPGDSLNDIRAWWLGRLPKYYDDTLRGFSIDVEE